MRSSLVFVVSTFAVSWLLWLAAAAILNWDFSQPAGLGAIAGALYLLGVFAPAFVALGLVAQTEGRLGVPALLRRTLVSSVRARYYLFAVGYFAAIKLGVALIHRMAVGRWPIFSETPWFLMLAAIPFSTPVQAGEEIGWRGFLLPRLATRIGLPYASIVVGAVWACWHLPFFFIAGTDKTGQSFPAYLMGVTALSVAMAWLYWRTGGSLLLTMVMHAAVNNTNLVPPAVSTSNPFAVDTSLLAWATVVLLWLSALFFLVAMRGERHAVLPQESGITVPA